jgi:hypothetical protein
VCAYVFMHASVRVRACVCVRVYVCVYVHAHARWGVNPKLLTYEAHAVPLSYTHPSPPTRVFKDQSLVKIVYVQIQKVFKMCNSMSADSYLRNHRPLPSPLPRSSPPPPSAIDETHLRPAGFLWKGLCFHFEE